MTETVFGPTSVGLFADVPMEGYLRHHGVNASLLKLFHKSAAHVRAEQTVPKKETPALKLGTAIHTSILEPDTFQSLYCLKPDGIDRRTKVGKKAWEDLLLANPGKEILTRTEWDVCHKTRKSVWASPAAKSLLSAKQAAVESTVGWKDDDTGLLCKCRPDLLASAGGWSFVVNLKSTKDASARGFAREVANYGWHIGAAMTLEGLQYVAPFKRRHLFLAVEKVEPYACGVYELGESSALEGENLYRAYLERYAECTKSEVWQGYPAAYQSTEIQLPEWAFRMEEYGSDL